MSVARERNKNVVRYECRQQDGTQWGCLRRIGPLVCGLFLTLSLSAGQTPYLGVNASIPGLVEAENYDQGGEGVAWHDSSAGNQLYAFRSDDVDVGQITGGGYHIGGVVLGEWVEYTVNVAATQQYTVSVRVASDYGGPNTFHLELDGANVSGTQSVASTGGWNAYVIKTFPVSLTAGSGRILKISFDAGAFNIDSLQFTVNATQAPYAGVPSSIPGLLQAENFDTGGDNVAWHDTTAGNAFGVYRFDDPDVGTITTGGYHIGGVAAGEWTEYTVNVAASQQYTVSVRVASDYAGPNTFHLELDGTNVSGMQSVPPTGGWNAYGTKTFPVVLTAGPARILRISFDAGAFNLDSLQFTVTATQGPYSGTAAAIPGVIQAENYDVGGEGLAWHDTTAGNAFGVYRPDDMDVGQISGGGYHIGGVVAGEWAEYTVDVATTRQYTATVRVASDYAGPNTFHLELNGVDVSGVQAVAPTGGWSSYITKTFSVSMTAGTRKTLRVAFDGGAFNLDSIQFAVPTCAAPTIAVLPNVKPIPYATVTWEPAFTGAPSPTVKWFKNNVYLPRADETSSKLQLLRVEQAKDGGEYYATATNSCGSVTTNKVVLRVGCNEGPDEMLENVSRALQGGGDVCEWTTDIITGFPNSFGGGKSYNKPVITAATAYIREPVRPGVTGWNMNDWWRKYLQNELGDNGTVWYYGGEELASGDYQKYNMAAMLALRYQANKVGDVELCDLAGRWLRATIALQAIAAVPHLPDAMYANGQVKKTANRYDGPYTLLAGERSPWGMWVETDRNALMGWALDWPNNAYHERSAQAGVRSFVQSRWTGFRAPKQCPTGTSPYSFCDENAYGLNVMQAAALRNAVTSHVLPANFVSAYLGAGLRSLARYHIVAWPGVRATLMEENRNNQTAPTYGAVYFTAPHFGDGEEAHFLYPWPGLWDDDSRMHRDTCTGTATLDLGGHLMHGEHPDCYTGPPGPDHQPTLRQPARQEFIFGLPAGPPNYHVVLSPDRPPSTQ